MNEPGWVTATVNLRALKKLRSAGEMRNFADWRSSARCKRPEHRQVEIVTSRLTVQASSAIRFS